MSSCWNALDSSVQSASNGEGNWLRLLGALFLPHERVLYWMNNHTNDVTTIQDTTTTTMIPKNVFLSYFTYFDLFTFSDTETPVHSSARKQQKIQSNSEYKMRTIIPSSNESRLPIKEKVIIVSRCSCVAGSIYSVFFLKWLVLTVWFTVGSCTAKNGRERQTKALQVRFTSRSISLPFK